MKAYKLEILIIDHDELGEDGIEQELCNTRFANDCINLRIKLIKDADIGEWHDNHPLNSHLTCDAEYKRLFP